MSLNGSQRHINQMSSEAALELTKMSETGRFEMGSARTRANCRPHEELASGCSGVSAYTKRRSSR